MNEVYKHMVNQSGNQCFTVVIPTYNRAHTIECAIYSVINQTYPHFEIIVVDDGSTDGTDQVISKISDKRLTYIWQKNQGRCAARNSGATLARGDYITFLDSDDEAFPIWLESFATQLDKPQVGLVSGGCEIYVKGRSSQFVFPKNMGLLYENQQFRFLAGAFAVRKELFTQVGGYAEALRHSENTELALRLIPYCVAAGWQIISIQEPLVRYNLSPNGSTKIQIQERYDSATFILNRHKTRLKKVPTSYATYCRVAAMNAVWLGKKQVALHYFWQAIQTHPIQWKQYMQLCSILVPTFIHHMRILR